MEEEYVWETKDHTKIKVKDMETTHIINCIRGIKRGAIPFIEDLGWATDNDFRLIEPNIDKQERWIRIFHQELERRSISTSAIDKRLEERGFFKIKKTKTSETYMLDIARMQLVINHKSPYVHIQSSFSDDIILDKELINLLNEKLKEEEE